MAKNISKREHAHILARAQKQRERGLLTKLGNKKSKNSTKSNDLEIQLTP